jgi:selenocysteine lyase/cysteine desulfurase
VTSTFSDGGLAGLRHREFARLDEGGHAYLDYTGAALYGASQIAAHHGRLLRDVLGNPHSENPASAESTTRMQRLRQRVLTFFNADPGEYDVILTANASGAARLVGESFPFGSNSRFVLTADNHNSINGIRCYAQSAGADVCYVPLDRSLQSLDPVPWLDGAARDVPHLFAFPAQSNYSGHRHPLAWVEIARSLGYQILLDAAALVPTSPLNLHSVRPDFVSVSFYKMFGFPTGIGALIVRRPALDLLRRPWFAGGTVDWVSTQRVAHALREGAEAFEDGTPHFLAFDAVSDGLDLLEGIGMRRIDAHVRSMTAGLLDGLAGLRHPGGRPIIEFHGSTGLANRGGTVTFNVLDAGGRAVPFDHVVAAATARRVSVRGGCFCNPGCAEAALGFTADRVATCLDLLGRSFTSAAFSACVDGPVGAVRASVGIPTNAADIDRLLECLEGYRGVRLAA